MCLGDRLKLKLLGMTCLCETLIKLESFEDWAPLPTMQLESARDGDAGLMTTMRPLTAHCRIRFVAQQPDQTIGNAAEK